MLDHNSHVNILPRKTWEALGKPRIVFSPIQLRMEKQYFTFPLRILKDIEVDIPSAKTYAYFEVIYIMGDKDPYLTLLGIEWEFENYVVIDLKWKP